MVASYGMTAVIAPADMGALAITSSGSSGTAAARRKAWSTAFAAAGIHSGEVQANDIRRRSFVSIEYDLSEKYSSHATGEVGGFVPP